MRIQHNIIAMNAYRNYNTDTSALSKNLEKLSSGYKINRAGDDAAGLAISEKMRAQITGLNAAQKNVKDGISLVKTAEGAMQEIQDMLNRMDYLATQSANGTYDDPVDRLNLNKEMKALKSEINRIADSANFNGIKLLNGDLDGGAKDSVSAVAKDLEIPSSLGQLQADLGTKTILHTSTVAAGKTTFGVELGDFSFSNQTGESIAINIGGHEIKVTAGAVGTATAGNEAKATDIVAAIKDAANGNGVVKVDGTDVKINSAGDWTIGGTNFTVTANATGNGLVFTQKASDTTTFDGDMNVSITGSGLEETVAGTVTGSITTAGPNEDVAPSASAKAKYSYDFTGVTGLTASSYTVGIAGKSVTVKLADGATGLSDLLTAVSTELKKDANLIDDGRGTKYAVAINGNKIEFEATTAGDATTQNTAITGNATLAGATEKDEGFAKGTYNTQTTQTTPSAAGAEKRLASTTFTMTKEMLADGAKIRFGDTEYEVSAKEADKNSQSKVYVGDLDLTKAADLKTAIDRLSVVAKDNAVWSVGHGTTAGKVTVTEKANASGTGWVDQSDANKKKYDLTTLDGIKKSLGYKTAPEAAVDADPTRGLTLQIGDTSDGFNQIKV